MGHELSGALSEVADVLAAENDLLARCDYRAVARLLPRKQDALDLLNRTGDLTAQRVEEELVRRVGRLAAENRRLLDVALEVQRRVLEIICGAARDALPAQGYGANGERSTPGTVAVALRVRA